MVDSAIGKVCPNCGNTEATNEPAVDQPTNTVATPDTPVPELPKAPTLPAPSPTISRTPATSMVQQSSSQSILPAPDAQTAESGASSGPAAADAPAAHALHSRVRVINPTPGFDPHADSPQETTPVAFPPAPPLVVPPTPAMPPAPAIPEPPAPQPRSVSATPAIPGPIATPGIAIPTMKPPATNLTAVTASAPGPSPSTPPSQPLAAAPVPPISSAMPTPNPGPVVMADMKPTRSKGVVVVGVSALILLTAGAALAVKGYIVDPKTAPTAYMSKLITAKTGQFGIDASYSEPQDATASSLVAGTMALKASGSYDVSKPESPISDTKLAATWSQYKISGEVITQPKTAYFKIDGANVLQNFGIRLNKDWYSYPISQEGSAPKCGTNHSKSGSLFGMAFPKSLPVTHAKRVGLYERVNGHYASHYKGVVDLQALSTVIDDANKQLSADCKIDYDKDSMKHTAITYDIWRGSGFDRAVFVITESDSQSKLNLTIDTQGYNQPVKIEAPKNAKPFRLEGLFGDDGTSNSADDTPPIVTTQS